MADEWPDDRLNAIRAHAVYAFSEWIRGVKDRGADDDLLDEARQAGQETLAMVDAFRRYRDYHAQLRKVLAELDLANDDPEMRDFLLPLTQLIELGPLARP